MTSNQFEEVELTAEEMAEALRSAREVKHYTQKKIEYLQSLERASTRRLYNARELYEFYRRGNTGENLVDDDNRNAVHQLCLYFANDDRFQGDLSKGLLLQGPVGCGKTTLMKFFMKNQRKSFRVEPCQAMQQRFSATGEESIKEFFTNVPIASNADPFGHQEIGFCFDDLGTEGDGVFYGIRKNIMAEVLSMRYSNELEGVATHITTNLSGVQIRDTYGDRVADRIREKFNSIQFNVNAPSRRK